MKIVNVPLGENTYKIAIGSGILPKVGVHLKTLKLGQDAVIITNPVVNRYHGKALVGGLKNSGFTVKVLQVPDGEKSKSAKTAFRHGGPCASACGGCRGRADCFLPDTRAAATAESSSGFRGSR